MSAKKRPTGLSAGLFLSRDVRLRLAKIISVSNRVGRI